MNEFFQVLSIEAVMAFRQQFTQVSGENVRLDDALDRVVSEDIVAPADVPGFDRATMDGFAVQSASTFGASESNPAYLEVVGSVHMGRAPDIRVGAGQAARVPTGGMLPAGSDAVVMVEHTDVIDATTVEIHRSVAPGQHMVARDEDVPAGQVVLPGGCRLKPQHIGMLAAIGRCEVPVFRRPRVGIISTGDEVLPPDRIPAPGQIRDINSHTLSALVQAAGGVFTRYGIVDDDAKRLLATCEQALAENDMVLVSGGSSVGIRDLTYETLEALPQSQILVHGVSIRPGKPTILAQCGSKAFWGLPGHVTSAMIVFMVLVKPFLEHVGGCVTQPPQPVQARLSRNLPSVQGRVDYVRVRLKTRGDELWAEPLMGQSGLIHTMTSADGLIAVPLNSEGLDQGAPADVFLIQ
jgi:molybdopterin molybdotransferase